MKVSGTSMSSPQVANLAAKLIALIAKGADEEKRIDPARTMAMARASV